MAASSSSPRGPRKGAARRRGEGQAASGGEPDALAIGLAEVDGHVVAAWQENMLVISFHPELAGETRLHRLFLEGIAR